MKNIIIMMMLLWCLLVVGNAQEKDVNWFAKTGVMSKYLGSIGSIFDDDPIAVTEAGVTQGDWTFGLWTATGLQGKSYGTTYADEIDVYAVWVKGFDWVRIEVSSSYYALAQLDLMSDDMWVIESEASFTKVPFVEPYIRIRYFGEIGTDSPKGGMFYYGGIRKSTVLGQGFHDRAYLLNLNLSTAYAGGAFHDPTGFTYGRFITSVDIPIGKYLTVSPVAIYQLGTKQGHPNRFSDKEEFVFGGNIKVVW